MTSVATQGLVDAIFGPFDPPALCLDGQVQNAKDLGESLGASLTLQAQRQDLAVFRVLQ
jgi:hypothetical protein